MYQCFKTTNPRRYGFHEYELLHAIQNGNENEALRLLDSKYPYLDETDDEGNSLLRIAYEMKQNEVLRELYKQGVGSEEEFGDQDFRQADLFKIFSESNPVRFREYLNPEIIRNFSEFKNMKILSDLGYQVYPDFLEIFYPINPDLLREYLKLNMELVLDEYVLAEIYKEENYQLYRILIKHLREKGKNIEDITGIHKDILPVITNYLTEITEDTKELLDAVTNEDSKRIKSALRLPNVNVNAVVSDEEPVHFIKKILEQYDLGLFKLILNHKDFDPEKASWEILVFNDQEGQPYPIEFYREFLNFPKYTEVSGDILYSLVDEEEEETIKNLEKIKLIFNHPKSDINKVSTLRKNSPMESAIMFENMIMFRFLLENPKFDINAPVNNYGDTPLTYAIREGKQEIINMLLNYPKTDVTIANKQGEKPIDLARARGMNDIVDIIQRMTIPRRRRVRRTLKQVPDVLLDIIGEY